jgi:hypothetical protein
MGVNPYAGDKDFPVGLDFLNREFTPPQNVGAGANQRQLHSRSFAFIRG